MTHPLLIFINPASGANLAGRFMEAISDVEGITFVKLPDEQNTFAEKHSELLHNHDMRVIAAGGDGTVNWVISLLSKVFPLESEEWKPPIAVCPFGTGNDMARSLGWGGGMSDRDLRHAKKYIEKVRSSEHFENGDIWKVKMTRTDSGEVQEKQMLNYFSIGVDADMATKFETCRHCCKCCFCCHCMSKALYVPMGFAALCGNYDLRRYLEVKTWNTDDQGVEVTKTLDFRCCEKTFTVQNIPSIYGGRDLWRVNTPRSVHDKKLEIVTQGGSAKLGLTHLGIYLGHAQGQATKIEATADEPCVYQVDGEGAIMNGPCKFEIIRTGHYPFVFAK